jgi:catechol 2,3-dioxygenase-like lactoylglutathione lyase family enzyme
VISRIQVVTVHVSDIHRSIAFYTTVLGFDVVADWRGDGGERMVFVLPPGAQTELGLYCAGVPDPRVGSGEGIVLTADDIRETVESLRRQGVHFTRELTMHDYGDGDRESDTGDIEAEFADPDGNRFVLHS